MGLLKIKLKKTWDSFKRDGFLTTGSRVWSAIRAGLAPVRKGETLIVTGGIGDSARYRAYHQAEYLKLNGGKTSVTTQDNPWLCSYVDKFDKFIFHRVFFDKKIAKLINLIKRAKKKIVFDIDDLVYDPQYLQFMDYYKKMSATERELYKNGVGSEILLDPYVTECTAATTFLAQKLRELGKHVNVKKNRLSVADSKWAEKILHVNSIPREKVSIGYFSGTRSHDKDFETITGPLAAILTKYPNVVLVIAGPLNIHAALEKFDERIVRLPFVNRKKHFKNILNIDINLIPLEVGNPFCEAKSEIKFSEAGILGKPSIASSTGTFLETIENNIDGLVASNDQEWEQGLIKLIENVSFRKQLGQSARQKVLREYINKKEN